MLKATTAVFINKYHPNANNLCSVSIRVTHEGKKRYYPTPFNLSVADFQKVMGDKPRGSHKETAIRLQAFERKAVAIIDQLSMFSWIAFEKLYLTNRAAKDTLKFAFTEYSKSLREDERIGTAVSYECAQRSLEKFAPDAKFTDVSPDFLQSYERWMLANKNSITTVGIYLRSLRSLFNNLISEGLLGSEIYPFGKKKYEIPTGRNIKKALTLNDIAAIYNYKAISYSVNEMARDYWLFLYLCNGLNVKDMCRLKYQNVQGHVIIFNRAKTIRTKRVLESIRIVMTDDVQRIIEKWGNKKKDSENFIFPVLEKDITADREYKVIQQLTGLINDHMRIIAKELKIERNVTTYFARHCFATILQRSGASTEFISEALGHSDVRTTQNYLGGFEDDKKKETVKALLAFEKTQ